MTTLETSPDAGPLAGEHRMLIDGELQTTASGQLFDEVNPATEEVAGQATDGTVADMERAVGAARRAFDTTAWSRDVEFRYHCLIQLRDALVEEKERLRRIVITEVGTPIAMTHSIQLEFRPASASGNSIERRFLLRRHQPARRLQAERPWPPQRRAGPRGVPGDQDHRAAGLTAANLTTTKECT